MHFTRGKWGFENDSSFLRAGSSYLRAASFGLPTNNNKARGTIALVNHAKTRSFLYLASPHGPNHCHHQFCTAAWCNRVTLHTFLLTVFFQEASLLQVSPRDNSPSLVAGFNPSPRNYDHQHPISCSLVETKHRTPQPALA